MNNMNPMISFNRSNSSIAFDNFFNPTHSVDDILDDTLVDMCPFEALLGPLPENPDQICDIFMNDKAGRNLIDEFLPSSPESIDQSVHSPPPSSEYTADSPFLHLTKINKMSSSMKHLKRTSFLLCKIMITR